MNQQLLRQIPKMDLLLAQPLLEEACAHIPYGVVKSSIQTRLDRLREMVLNGDCAEIPTLDNIVTEILQDIQDKTYFSLKRVINATGVVLHTNLGRAPLGAAAMEHLAQIASGYCNLEYDLEAGKRGSRYAHVERLLCRLTGAEGAMVVNNNAGAVFLMLNTLANGRRVAISRGELVEIGGSFRVPDIMERSGAELVEVGTTNKTHLKDYRRAVETQEASVLLKVHTSNFVMQGFTQSVSLKELAELGQERECLVLHDLGSGFLFPSETLGLHQGEELGRSLREGADVVCFSGDKLLGSAQCGILLGKKRLIDQIRSNQLTRMLRIDKLSLAALEWTLQSGRDARSAKEQIPALRMLAMTGDECMARAVELEERIRQAAPGLHTQVLPAQDEPGGGSLPGVLLDGAAVAVSLPGAEPEELERRLRGWKVPIIARISHSDLLLSPRTLCPGDGEAIVCALAGMKDNSVGGTP